MSSSASSDLDAARALGLADSAWARVASVDAEHAHLVSARGPSRLPVARGARAAALVVGDIVDGVTGTPHERRGVLQRSRDDDRALGHDRQVLAAHVDEVWCVVAVDQGVNARRLERAQLMAYDADARPVVVLTKADLVDETALAALVSSIEAAALGCDVVVCSAQTGRGVDALRARLSTPREDACARTAALLGVSGAGKSALLNALVGETVGREGALRDDDARGRHTTSSRALHVLRGGGCVIDTPGLRAFGVAADDDDVERVFSDVVALASGCRFRDCAHDREPGCAVRDIVDAARLRAYRALKAEAALRRAHDPSSNRSGHEKREARRRDRAFTNMAWEAGRQKRR